MSAKKILIVEDEIIVAKELAVRLTRLGYSIVDVCRSGAEAIENVSKLHPDLVLMDIRLSGEMNGIEAAKEIQKSESTIVIFLTANSDAHTFTLAQEVNPFGFIIKPLTDRQLEISIELALSKADSERKLRLSEQKYRLLLEQQTQAQAEIASNERKFRHLVQNLPVGFARINLKTNRYEFVNSELEKQVGISSDEFLQFVTHKMYLMQYIHPDDRARCLMLFLEWKKTVLSGNIGHDSFRLLRPDHSVIWVDSYLYGETDAQGNISSFNHICIDITNLKNAESALEESLKEDFRRVVQHQQNHIFRVIRNNTGEYFYSLSEGMIAQKSGLTTNQILGKPLSTIFTSEIYERIKKHLDCAFAGETMLFQEEYENIHYQTMYTPITSDGIVTEVIGSSFDITQQKSVENELRVSEERYRLLIEVLPIAVMKLNVNIKTREWTLDFINQETSVQTGYTFEELRDSIEKDTIFIHPDDNDSVMKAWQYWIDGNRSQEKNIYLSYRFRHKDGHYLWLDNYSIKQDNPQTGVVEVIQVIIDVSQKKAAEQDLQAALKKERELNMLKSRFVSTVSHEFRTPLTGILGSAELLDRYGDKISAEQHKTEIKKIKSHVIDLAELMDDFVLQSSTNRMTELFRPTLLNFGELCTDCVNQAKSPYSEHQQSISLTIQQDLPFIEGDRRLLIPVIQNLLSNALKYSPNDSHITVIIEKSGDGICCSVSDEGIGIPGTEITQIFEPFFRASNISQTQGTGLGLPIVKEFVELHHGKISVEARLGQGSTFTIWLPLKQPK